MHTQYLKSLLATAPQWGLAIDSESLPYGNTGEPLPDNSLCLLIMSNFSTPSAWTLHTSAFVSDNAVRDTLIQSIHNHANSNLSGGIFPERYDITNNAWRNGLAG